MLERNQLWSDNADEYIKQLITNCCEYRYTMLSHPPRKVSLCSINRSFNQLVCVHHISIDEYCILHAMNTKTRFSVSVICNDTSMNIAMYVLQMGWLTPFWSPEFIRCDDDFNNSKFKDFFSAAGTNFEFIAPRQHQKNVLESKHGILRFNYPRLLYAQPATDEKFHIAM